MKVSENIRLVQGERRRERGTSPLSRSHLLVVGNEVPKNTSSRRARCGELIVDQDVQGSDASNNIDIVIMLDAAAPNTRWMPSLCPAFAIFS